MSKPLFCKAKDSLDKQYLSIAVPTPLDRLFTYTSESVLSPGVRVKVPFGPRSLIGVVCSSTSEVPEESGIRYRDIKEIIDTKPVYSNELLQLAHWLSQYYMHPIGEVLRTMLPASHKSQKSNQYSLSPAGTDFISSNLEHSEVLRHCFGKRIQLTQATLRKKLKAWPEDVLSLEKWFQNKGYIKIKSKKVVSARKIDDGEIDSEVWRETESHDLTDEQRSACDLIDQERQKERASDLKPILLQGITGSGKTEVYLQTISKVIKDSSDAQVLMMVPEISLTPQMTSVFRNRFPGQVAVVHSAMSDNERWSVLESIRSNAKRILIGPRSAIFAPFENLALIIVDEEHDQSYKQGTGLPYNGRDVAVVRGKIEKALVVLGSATPSMETYWNAKQDRYIHILMQKRATGVEIPKVVVIENEDDYSSLAGSVLKNESDLLGSDAPPISKSVIQALLANHKDGKQSIVIVNRRGFAFYLFDLTEKKAVCCPDCSVSLTVHSRNKYLKCHYCDFQTTTEKIMQKFPDHSFSVMGYGSQKAEDFLKEQLSEARVVRLDSDVAMNKDALSETLNNFRNHEIDVLVGTQILAKGHDFPKVTLMVIVEVEKQLNLPDFRAGERTFQLLVQASGRAGRAQEVGRVMVQSKKPDHPVIQLAKEQGFEEFAERELAFRKLHAFPPFTRMVAIEYNSEGMPQLLKFDDQVDRWLETYEKTAPTMKEGLKISGPIVPPIQTIRGRHRRQVIIKGECAKTVRSVAGHFMKAFEKRPHDIRMKIDVDPQTLL
ncbi:primosomal protein N' [Oligoflexaceae bacterium]|nr:primosomal protein N' [Oligoflexaceae bacterium]